MKKKLLIGILALIAVAVFSALYASRSEPISVMLRAKQRDEMRVVGISDLPGEVEVGGTIRWVNDTDAPVMVRETSGLFHSGVLEPGDEYEFRFALAGEYEVRVGGATMTVRVGR